MQYPILLFNYNRLHNETHTNVQCKFYIFEEEIVFSRAIRHQRQHSIIRVI